MESLLQEGRVIVLPPPPPVGMPVALQPAFPMNQPPPPPPGLPHGQGMAAQPMVQELSPQWIPPLLGEWPAIKVSNLPLSTKFSEITEFFSEARVSIREMYRFELPQGSRFIVVLDDPEKMLLPALGLHRSCVRLTEAGTTAGYYVDLELHWQGPGHLHLLPFIKVRNTPLVDPKAIIAFFEEVEVKLQLVVQHSQRPHYNVFHYVLVENYSASMLLRALDRHHWDLPRWCYTASSDPGGSVEVILEWLLLSQVCNSVVWWDK